VSGEQTNRHSNFGGGGEGGIQFCRTIGVEDFRREAHFGWLIRVLVAEGHTQAENPPLPMRERVSGDALCVWRPMTSWLAGD
jgi:hypothetical protein